MARDDKKPSTAVIPVRRSKKSGEPTPNSVTVVEVEKTRPKIIIVSSPKGGVGKTTIAAHICVQAAREGYDVAVLDADKQHSLAGWYEDRLKHEFDDENLTAAKMPIDKWNKAFAAFKDKDLIVVDCPPEFEREVNDYVSMIQLADIVIVPTGYSSFDLKSVCPFMDTLRQRDVNAMFVINNANKKANAVQRAALELNGFGNVFHAPIPRYEAIMALTNEGLTAFERQKKQGEAAVDIFRSLWKHVKRDIRMPEVETRK